MSGDGTEGVFAGKASEDIVVEGLEIVVVVCGVGKTRRASC